jgi:hypothetical protein
MIRPIAVAAVLLSACATGSQAPPELPVPGQRIIQPGYSFLPPAERGWHAGPRDQFRVSIAKRGSHADESYAVQGSVFRLPRFETTAELAQIVKEGMQRDTDPTRFAVTRHDVVPDASRPTECVRSHAVAEDRNPVKRTSRAGPMVLELVSLTCAHPKNKSVGIDVTYSHRYYAGGQDASLPQKADHVLASVEFGALP